MKKSCVDEKRRGHPYLSGNFAPIQQELPLTPCSYTGKVPEELAGGEYVRNGSNPVTNEALGRDAHWFDGDGMLSGVAFRVDSEDGNIRPEFVNKYILTDVYQSSKTNRFLKTPILPSITTLVNPMSSLITIILRILRTITLVILSHLPGSMVSIKRISVANTAVLYHDGRALATCESGPPMRISLPGLETIGWYDGITSEGELDTKKNPGFGGGGNSLISFMKEWTTAHPRVDPNTKELILYHSTFLPPYIHYSIVPTASPADRHTSIPRFIEMLNMPVPGVGSAKMMHDFGVSSTHTIIMDLPLSLDPLNLAKNKPVVAYDPTARSRFGVFPRYEPHNVRWFETNPCCIFHTANSWTSTELETTKESLRMEKVNMLACRLTSASLVFSAGDVAAPQPAHSIPIDQEEEDQCRLYYYQFGLPQTENGNKHYKPNHDNVITHQWGLSAITFEFPSLRDSVSMSPARYIYGCSVSGSSFGTALGRAVKINSLVKMDVKILIERGVRNPPKQITGCVDNRTMAEVLESNNVDDPIKVFQMPEGWYAQESRFVPRARGCSEDDGWILSYVFDESQLDQHDECSPNSTSELWIIDAKNMTDVVAKVQLPQRVPYGLHGNWFSEEDIKGQRPVDCSRVLPNMDNQEGLSPAWRAFMATRRAIEAWLE